MSYSGLLTDAIRRSKDHDRRDLSLSLLEVAYGMLAEVAERRSRIPRSLRCCLPEASPGAGGFSA